MDVMLNEPARGIPLSGISAAVIRLALNVRSGPDTRYDVKGRLELGAEVTCIAAEGDWFQIRTGALQGFVSSRGLILIAGEPARTIVKGLSERPAVSLTFDAGDDRGWASDILDVLHGKGVTASFGLTGTWAMKNPDLVRRIVDEGHHLVNHTSSHRSFTGFSPKTDPLSPAERLGELEAAESTIRRLSGQSCKPWCRLPFGDIDPEALHQLAAAGFHYHVRWTVDSLGWKGLSVDDIVARVIRNHGNGYIYLFHLGHGSQDGPALPQIIDGLRGYGYTLASVPHLISESFT